jgi:hypothetical protein
MKIRICFCLLLLSVCWAGQVNAQASATGAAASGARDFDFLHGSWNVQNRMRKARLKGSNEWWEFPATLAVRPILDGQGNVDQYKATIGNTYLEGLTLRLFHPKTKQWSLHWVDNLTMELQTPLVGGFKNGRGEFFADDVYEGKKVKARFIWSDITPNSARWEQAYSTDGGRTWEVNWMMSFTRSKEP